MSALASDGQRLTPPLAPELWNFGVIAVICGLVGWLMRLTQHFLTLVDLRFAAHANAVLHLNDLGSSLSVLENATMWHFQQLSRTKLDVTSSKMATVRIPFEVAPVSLAVSRAPETDTPGAARASASSAPMRLSFSVRASAKCVVQVLWGVKTDALLEQAHHFASASSSLSSPRSPSLRDRIPVLRRLSSQQRSMRQRAADLSTFLSRLRRQNRRHRLHDDRLDAIDGAGERGRGDSSLAGFSLEHMVGDASFQSASPCTRFDTWGEHDIVVEMPHSSAAGPLEEVQSLLSEVESDLPTNAVRAAPASPVSEPRYSAVVLVGALDVFDDAASLGAKHVARDDSDVVCQCVAIDFLPTPTRLEKVSPVIVKRFTITLAGVYVQQEIFGRSDASASECVICLEGELAVVLLPCRHLCVCRACLREIDRCPICRAKFSTYVCFADNGGGGAARDDDSKAASLELKVV